MRNSNQIREAAKTESNQVTAEILVRISECMDRLTVSEAVAEGMIVRGLSRQDSEDEAKKEEVFVSTARALKYI
jgi:hypothetical protein